MGMFGVKISSKKSASVSSFSLFTDSFSLFTDGSHYLANPTLLLLFMATGQPDFA
jgi:hypothetical protein